MGTNGSIATLPPSESLWAKERRPKPWSCGERSLTESAPMRRWVCVARPSSIATRAGTTMGRK